MVAKLFACSEGNMKVLLSLFICLVGLTSTSFAAPAQYEQTLKSLVQNVCHYNQLVLIPKSRYGACFDNMNECLSSPLWDYKETATSFWVTGGFGYSCHFEVDKGTNQVVQFRLTDPGE
jgi:hypothetical protein